MTSHRLIIWRHDRLLGHFDSHTPWSREAVEDIAARLGEGDGYRLERQAAEGERRLLESTPGGIRVLGIEPLFATIPLNP
ncbi:cytoplasmic protein [Pseudothauera nasutitermitis]|uniref:Cytoplasmic protein n=1 Tax=Pseudothauera nasutitermitis TaxID=2565930 RepID=A0A4S4AZI2_9RHOO|nr:cytoplasmic protein [Pseudothauera nasutitermitis]THF65573.1 cytoplasmic protein [Pseudothauera nasutitermitis]